MNLNNRYLTLFLALAVALVVGGIAVNILSEGLSEKLRLQLGEDYKFIILMGAVLLALIPFLWSERDKIFNKSLPESVLREEFAHFKTQLADTLYNNYKIRLQKKIANRMPINLRLEYTTEGTSKTYTRAYFNVTEGEVKEEIQACFRMHNRLLIIGEPGSGKTTLLLQLALMLYAEKDLQIPIIINLSSWTSEYANFHDWLELYLNQSVQGTISKENAKRLLDEKVLLPLFDGLDEVHADHRKDCLDKMRGYFGDSVLNRFVVCSRTFEYKKTDDAIVFAEIKIQPLRLEQIKAYLDTPHQHHIGHKAFLLALDKDPVLAQAVQEAVYLNMQSKLYEAMNVTFPYKAQTKLGRQKEIETLFIETQLATQRNYTIEKVKSWLGFLGQKMNEKGLVVFELVDIQPEWCRLIWAYRILTSFIYANFLGLSVVISVGFDSLKLVTLIFFLITISGIFFIEDNISTNDISVWKWKHVYRNLKKIIFLSLIGMVLGPVISKIAILIRGTPTNFNVNGFIIASAIFGFIWGLSFGVTYSGMITSILLKTENAYQRFSSSLKYNIIVYGLTIAIGLIVLGVVNLYINNIFTYDDWLNYLTSNNHLPLFGLIGLISIIPLSVITTSAFLQHVLIRFILFTEKKFPIRLTTFLNKMESTNLIERDGGTWRFHHKIVQDYFAKLYSRNSKIPDQKKPRRSKRPARPIK